MSAWTDELARDVGRDDALTDRRRRRCSGPRGRSPIAWNARTRRSRPTSLGVAAGSGSPTAPIRPQRSTAVLATLGAALPPGRAVARSAPGGVGWTSTMTTPWAPPTSPAPTEGPLVDTFGRVADDLRDLGHRPLQLPVHLLHAGRGARLAPQGGDPHVRGAHPAAGDLRRARACARSRSPAGSPPSAPTSRRWSGCSAAWAPTSTSRSPRTACCWTGSPRRSPRPAWTARRSRATR